MVWFFVGVIGWSSCCWFRFCLSVGYGVVVVIVFIAVSPVSEAYLYVASGLICQNVSGFVHGVILLFFGFIVSLHFANPVDA